MNHLLSHLQHDSEIEWKRSPERGRLATETTVTVTSRYFRALAKIGFHYFLKQMVQFHGSEDAFANIRAFIMQGGIGDVEKFVQTSEEQIAVEAASGKRPENYCHLLSTGINYQWLVSKLQFFLGPGFLPPIYLIKIGENPSLIWHREMYAHAFIYYRDGQQGGYDGIVSTGDQT